MFQRRRAYKGFIFENSFGYLSPNGFRVGGVVGGLVDTFGVKVTETRPLRSNMRVPFDYFQGRIQ